MKKLNLSQTVTWLLEAYPVLEYLLEDVTKVVKGKKIYISELEALIIEGANLDELLEIANDRHEEALEMSWTQEDAYRTAQGY